MIQNRFKYKLLLGEVNDSRRMAGKRQPNWN